MLVGLGIIGALLALVGAGLFVYAIVKRTQDNTRGSLKYGSTEINIPGPIFLCVVGIVAFVIAISLYEPSSTQGSPDGSTSHLPSQPSPASSSTTALPVTTFVIDDPPADAGVHGDFSISGRSPDLHGGKLWIFVYSGNPTGGFVYYKTSDDPILISNGTWATTQASLGSDQDVGAWFDLVAVRADAACHTTILGIKPDSEGNLIVGHELPPGCSKLAVRRVKKTG